MSKAAFYMNEQMKRNFPLVQSIHPTLAVGRGKLRFQQGLDYIASVFRGCSPSEVYTHHYFIEKQTDPSQPSPQTHLTEEYQGMLRVMKGLQYMQDKSSKLDTTMVAVIDSASGDVYLYNPSELDESAMTMMVDILAGWNIPEAQREAARMRHAKGEKPMKQHRTPSHIQNEGSELAMNAEAASMSDGATAPSAYPRFQNAAMMSKTTQGKHDAGLPALRRVAGIILPTRQTLWQPMAVWAALFPDAAILTSLDVSAALPIPPSVTHGLLPEQVEALRKRCVPLATLAKRKEGDGQIVVLPHATASTRLVLVQGDEATNEYVMVHDESSSLSCTDLFHGAYADFDPVNTWVCRVFFKFMKDGDYKRIDIPPRYKLDAVTQGGNTEAFSRTIKFLCSDPSMNWETLLFAHGTPPVAGNGREALRDQWRVLTSPESHVSRPKNEDAPISNPEIYGNVAKTRPEEDFLLRRRRF